ncbi:PAS domain S-box-containing protein [Thalassobacillus cyri]|uniref:HTH-type transcriptional regulatory protein TyrR n=1 Tax=Thalassobacillus cyri TaxID=571932 RepID=A0A1H4E2W9_9BACI|nr:sigma 54-interacting transcriptional regulator [Thalassobacillus cyri]SEA79108.1 PAS domain S-box-containing protein [Thalassobacillus cyri]
MLQSGNSTNKSAIQPTPNELQLLDSIIQSSYDGIFVADANGIGWTMNEAYTRITGVSKDKLLYRELKDVIKDGIISDSVTYKVLEEKKAITIVQTVNGTEVLATGNPVLDDKGEVTHVVTNIRDLRDLNYLKSEIYSSRMFSDSLMRELEQRNENEIAKPVFRGVIAHSRELRKQLKIAKKVAKVDSLVLLTGESGAGKEAFADFIYEHSPRKGQPYLKVNCAAIPSSLLEAELFGYEKGAFTGAITTGKVGLFEKANGGTILLDEIGEIPKEFQVKLLRVLQELEIKRVGGTHQIPLNIRVIAATNRNLEELVNNGEFREDLYYRLNVVPIHIPPLRKRTADIIPLANYFLEKLNEKLESNLSLHPDTLPVLENYSWPGNIRELENVLERAAILSEEEHILPSDLSLHNARPQKHNLKELVNRYEAELIQDAIEEHKTTRKAAASLGISQSALVKKMKKFQLTSKEYIHE